MTGASGHMSAAAQRSIVLRIQVAWQYTCSLHSLCSGTPVLNGRTDEYAGMHACDQDSLHQQVPTLRALLRSTHTDTMMLAQMNASTNAQSNNICLWCGQLLTSWQTGWFARNVYTVSPTCLLHCGHQPKRGRCNT